MKFLTCTLSLKFTKNFGVSDEAFQKLFSSAVLTNPSCMAFDLNFNYEGVVGETGIQIGSDEITEGSFCIKGISGSEYIIDASCQAEISLPFMSDAGAAAFETAVQKGALETTIASICNNGPTASAFWSMECAPYISITNAECVVNIQ